MKWRPNHLNGDSQFRMDAPYGHQCGEEECIKILPRSTFEEPHVEVTHIYLPKQGYGFVETEDPRDRLLYRYEAGLVNAGEPSAEKRAGVASGPFGADPGTYSYYYRCQIRREPIKGFTARYGITWDDSFTDEDRANRVAGGSLSIIDMKTSQVVAERVGYMWEQALGRSSEFRQPWDFSSTDGDCESLQDSRRHHLRWRATMAPPSMPCNLHMEK